MSRWNCVCVWVCVRACKVEGFQVSVDFECSCAIICICEHVCRFLQVGFCVSKMLCVWCVHEERRYSRGVWSLHLLRTSEGVKSTDCPNRSHWDSNPRLRCAWASLERQERGVSVCVCVSVCVRVRRDSRDRRKREGWSGGIGERKSGLAREGVSKQANLE